MYVGEVCWWKVLCMLVKSTLVKQYKFSPTCIFTNILHQHKNSHFSPTSFINIKTAIKIRAPSKKYIQFYFFTKIGVVYYLWGINNTIVVNYTILAIILSKWHVIGSIWLPEMIPRIILPSIRHKQHHFRFPFPRIFQVQLPV